MVRNRRGKWGWEKGCLLLGGFARLREEELIRRSKGGVLEDLSGRREKGRKEHDEEGGNGCRRDCMEEPRETLHFFRAAVDSTGEKRDEGQRPRNGRREATSPGLGFSGDLVKNSCTFSLSARQIASKAI